MSSGTWRPLVAGDLADRTRGVVEEIAAALAQDPPIPFAESWDATVRSARSASLAGGRAGQAVFYTYLAEAFGVEGHADLAARALDEAVDLLASEPMRAGLYGGFTGVAWATEHLEGRLFESPADGEDPNQEIDAAVLDLLERASPWGDTYDLIGGLVGYAVYAIERLPKPSAVILLERVIDHLDAMAEHTPEGISWFTPPHLLPEQSRAITPNGYYNLGVAHGVPGVVAVLADACRAGVRVERAAALLEGSVSWLLAQKLGAEDSPCFSYATGPGIEPRPSRLAWCYGDPGIAATLLYAARRVGNREWEREALAIASAAAALPPEQSGVKDAGICHGAVGLAHLYNRLFQATGDEGLAATARSWYERTLAMQAPGQGVAGFASWDVDPSGEARWAADGGFLTGAAGIGLALLAAISDVEPEWDRVLLTAVPPAGG